MFEFFIEPAFWASAAILIAMEIALGADNVVFIATIADKLAENERKRVLRVGLALAAALRLILLAGVVWILGLERTAFSLAGWSPSWRELVLLLGGLFLIYKAVVELHHLVEPRVQSARETTIGPMETGGAAIIQIALINAVFSVDSIITAVGLTSYVQAMAVAVLVSIAVLYFASEKVTQLLVRHPSVKTLALALLLMVGVMLTADGLGLDILRPYLYGAIAFAALVLAVSKTVQHFAHPREIDEPEVEAAQPEEQQPAAPVPDRVEPVLEPSDTLTSLEPEILDEDIAPPDRPDHDTEELPIAAVDDPEVIEDESASDDSLETDETEISQNDAEGPLGEAEDGVPKSRRKEYAFKRRPGRMRTGKRRG